ncbi:uncharacterized protein [Clytia hemisphaerica]|uniref:Uncharacterized protein n=1 Tax=Clytia hemisphaerica TaxID=252671 RepID=A0A7M5V9P2_9CNID
MLCVYHGILLLLFLFGGITNTQASGSWGSWVHNQGCYNHDVSGQTVQRYTRPCTGGTCDGGTNGEYFTYTCQPGYMSPGFKPTTSNSRSQCGPTCTGGQNFDGKFTLDFPFVQFPQTTMMRMYIKAKHGSNGQPDMGLVARIPSLSINRDMDTLRSNTRYWNGMQGSWGWGYFKRNATQLVYDSAVSQDKGFYLHAITSQGNRFEMDVEAVMTFNPSTDSETYISAAFYLHRFTDHIEVISIMQNKRQRAPTTSGTPEVVTLSERGPDRTSLDALYPAFQLVAQPWIHFGGTARTRDIFIRQRIPNLYFKIDKISITWYTANHPSVVIVEDTIAFDEALTVSMDDSKNEIHHYIPYVDPSQSWMSPIQKYENKVIEFQDSTYLERPINSIINDVSFCFETDKCDSSKPYQFQTNRGVGRFGTVADGQLPITPFRIKYLEGGLCWYSDITTSNKVLLSSRCRDLFTLGRHQFPSKPYHLWHVESKLLVNHAGGGNAEIYLHTDSRVPFLSRMGRLLTPYRWTQGDCIVADNERPTTSGVGGQRDPTACDENEININRTRTKYLPDYSAHYNVLSMKSILQTTVDGLKLLLVCDPKRDLKTISNCHYSTDDGLKWKGLSTTITQVKFIIPSEKTFYGYCNDLKYFCSMEFLSNRISYLDEATYNGKLSDLTMVTATNLDDMTLTPSSVDTSDDPDIGMTSRALSKLQGDGVTWNEIYIWTN